MGLIGHIILGILIIAAGIAILKYNYQVSNNLRIAFAEQHLGSGGSYLLWKIIGVVIVLAGLTVVFGIYGNIISWFFSPLTKILEGGA